jgi:hypothetical protein
MLTVMPREGGASSTPRFLDSITTAAGIMVHPLSQAMTSACVMGTAQTSQALPEPHPENGIAAFRNGHVAVEG